MTGKRAFPPLLAALVLLYAPAAPAAEAVVDIKDGKSMTVSVPLGTDHGVSAGSRFEIVAADNAAVRIRPVEIYSDRFWSQPLSRDDFGRVQPGMAVRPAPPPPEEPPGEAAKAKARPSLPPESVVDLKSEGSMSVSVPIGTAHGVSPESDFQVVAPDNSVVPVYPLELYADRFWSQPLSEKEYRSILPGMPVRPAVLSGKERARVRSEGEARVNAIRAKREEARREAAQRDIVELRRKKAELEDQRDAVEDRIAGKEKELADEEERLEWLLASEDRDVDRALQRVLDLADRRDEMQERRLVLSGERPVPRAEIDRLTAEIRRLNDRIDSERGAIRIARDRKRSGRYAFLSLRKEWKELVAERSRLDGEIRSVDRRIRDLVESLR